MNHHLIRDDVFVMIFYNSNSNIIFVFLYCKIIYIYVAITFKLVLHLSFCLIYTSSNCSVMAVNNKTQKIWSGKD